MIDPKAEPLYNTPPYKPIDIRYPGRSKPRPEIITREDYQNGVIPDEAPQLCDLEMECIR